MDVGASALLCSSAYANHDQDLDPGQDRDNNRQHREHKRKHVHFVHDRDYDQT